MVETGACAAAAGGGLSLCAVRRRRGGAADPGLSPGPAAAPAAGAAAAAAGGAGRRPAPGGHSEGGRLSQPCDPAGGKPPGHPHPGGAALRRHGGLLHHVGPPDQNPHRLHAPDPAKRGLRPGPLPVRGPDAGGAVCGDGAGVPAAGQQHHRLCDPLPQPGRYRAPGGSEVRRGVHPPPSAAGLSAPGPHRGHRRQVAGLRGGAGAVQRPEIHRQRLRDHRHGRR